MCVLCTLVYITTDNGKYLTACDLNTALVAALDSGEMQCVAKGLGNDPVSAVDKVEELVVEVCARSRLTAPAAVNEVYTTCYESMITANKAPKIFSTPTVVLESDCTVQ